ncbi:MAG TPA: STAS-like domain-containing protein, partial [Acidobacteriota bacterium]|nr:STAS-like domain-containing protein [Acidobacteriota bacterium]
TTTQQEKHSGEGVFFTSKSGDIVSIRSHSMFLNFDNLKNDLFVEKKRSIKGTEVHFQISKHTRRKLAAVFGPYAPEEFEFRFEKTRVHVRLYGENYVSRSEARRLLHGLDKFREIVLNFKNVKTMGQGFADEVFRVFLTNHPAVRIFVENLAPLLKPLILHSVDNYTKPRLTIG